MLSREEAKEEFSKCKSSDIVDKIYDSFDIDMKLAQKIIENKENEVCSNCTWFVDEVCCNGDSFVVSEFVPEDFGCNKFKEKQ